MRTNKEQRSKVGALLLLASLVWSFPALATIVEPVNKPVNVQANYSGDFNVSFNFWEDEDGCDNLPGSDKGSTPPGGLVFTLVWGGMIPNTNPPLAGPIEGNRFYNVYAGVINTTGRPYNIRHAVTIPPELKDAVAVNAFLATADPDQDPFPNVGTWIGGANGTAGPFPAKDKVGVDLYTSDTRGTGTVTQMTYGVTSGYNGCNNPPTEYPAYDEKIVLTVGNFVAGTYTGSVTITVDLQ